MDRELFAIFGNPVAHSRSPLMHNYTFQTLDYPACYGRYRLEEGERLREVFLKLGLKGANITVPHKEHAYRACDELDDFARKVGAVNTIVLRDGKLHGYNTDAPGFLRVVEEFGGGKRVLFLGAGGTAASTAMILREAGYEVTILNRSAGRLESFKEQGFAAYTWEEFAPGAYDLIVNMSSAGLEDESLPAPREILEPLLRRASGALDVIYGKETPFLRLARSLGVRSKDGSEMLLYQGVIAFDYFTEGHFDLEKIEKAMRESFFLD
ncbi:shikimate dehydrogenase [Nitratifractor salsuginis]|uniref:Shikimate dehydrogenase (NADP(+)) n=1 Tax=Nitratifractor salsuginis (strain DSM 16511 / JCM 12458 / E9I37-1) TaxID=749222 RepID=E6X1U9_NITSE|nr:shikimate dehydrogenase [Nitratifractor salsuginis]ADV45957.1 shikimate dehydrogenase [Nitratifractor salsuginis DSM 16511]